MALGLLGFGGPVRLCHAATKWLAALEFTESDLDVKTLNAFADAVRGGAVDALEGGGVKVMTRENMMVLLKEMGRECSAGSCEVETARNIGADFVISGTVAVIDKRFVVTLKLHETKGGSLLGTDMIDAKSQMEVLRMLREHAQKLVASKVKSASVPGRPGIPSGPALDPSQVRGCQPYQAPIPGGTFWMGSNDGEPDEKPVHKVTLASYCMDKTEVTVAGYRECVQDGGCPPPFVTVQSKNIKPEDRAIWSQFCNWGKAGLDEHPINCVDWNQAATYCEWRGDRLPTEAEWEFAARGSDARTYPWGDEPPDPTRLNACGRECVAMGKLLGKAWSAMYPGNDGWKTTAPAGSYPKGASPFGVLDMAGNVLEWTADVYGKYKAAAHPDPLSVEASLAPRVFRGGSWLMYLPSKVRAVSRFKNDPGDREYALGFRCARGADK
jgi:formylglycine-generating enzyme required for sulfatase activity